MIISEEVRPGRLLLNKVPEVTLAFWIIKIMSTTVGEAGADFLAVNAGLGNARTERQDAVRALRGDRESA